MRSLKIKEDSSNEEKAVLNPKNCGVSRVGLRNLRKGRLEWPEKPHWEWGAIFLNRFKLDKREELLSDQMGEAEEWFKLQRAIQTRGQKTKAPDEWRRKRIGAIKAAMNQMGVTNENYYPDLSNRLRMRKPFISLKELTKRDLDRVYNLALRDARGA